jgi:hypothetical protein
MSGRVSDFEEMREIRQDVKRGYANNDASLKTYAFSFSMKI